LKTTKAVATKKQALAKKIQQSLTNYEGQHKIFIEDLRELTSELNSGVSTDSLIDLKINIDPINAVLTAAQEEIRGIDAKLTSSDEGGLLKDKEDFLASIAEEKSKLGEKQRLFIHYKGELVKWEKSKLEIIGGVDKPNSIKWIEKEIESLLSLPEYLKGLTEKRLE